MLAISWSVFLNAVHHDISLCCVSVPVFVARFLTSISWDTKCIENIWYIFPKFSEVICLPFLTPGVLHMTCYLEFLVFWRQAIVTCSIESAHFVVFLALNDFLNIAKSHLNTFLFKVLVAFFWCMDGLYIILIIKACRIRIEPCRLDDTFEKHRLSISNEPLVKSWAKCLKRIQFGIEEYLFLLAFLCFQQSLLFYTLQSTDFPSSVFCLNTSLQLKQFFFNVACFGFAAESVS